MGWLWLSFEGLASDEAFVGVIAIALDDALEVFA
jgi:hypothetical protein